MTTRVFRAHLDNYRWEEVELHPYKAEGTAPFLNISRQTLFDDPNLKCQLRYFEVAAGGYSTLERHEHDHAVMILRGCGRCLVGNEVFEVKANDLLSIPPLTWHQFRASFMEPLGFLCMVNSERDRPQLPSEEELRRLCQNPHIAEFLSEARNKSA